MSVVVKGIKMPKVGDKFETCIDANGNIFLHRMGSLDDIYYVEQLPKHGRIVDVGKLIQDEQRFIYEDEYGDWYVPVYAINKAPTVLEADE